MKYENIIVEHHDRVGLITINRPKALNAFNQQLTGEFLHAVETLDRDSSMGCIVVIGSEKVFSTGSDIKWIQGRSYMDMYMNDHYSVWDELIEARTAIIAAVAGLALGGRL
jgi:enoyl-CoA hydratase